MNGIMILSAGGQRKKGFNWSILHPEQEVPVIIHGPGKKITREAKRSTGLSLIMRKRGLRG
jgi:hypothetical protein